jgi:hypothetical protein
MDIWRVDRTFIILSVLTHIWYILYFKKNVMALTSRQQHHVSSDEVWIYEIGNFSVLWDARKRSVWTRETAFLRKSRDHRRQ